MVVGIADKSRIISGRDSWITCGKRIGGSGIVVGTAAHDFHVVSEGGSLGCGYWPQPLHHHIHHCRCRRGFERDCCCMLLVDAQLAMGRWCPGL